MAISDKDWTNERVLVVGAGISGIAAARVLKKLGADVTLSDAKKRDGRSF